MESKAATKSAQYEQALMDAIRGLSIDRVAEVLDFAMFVRTRQPVITPPEALSLDERAWGQAAIRSLAQYWNTPEEDEAWADL